MGTETAIGWTNHTFNPWMGCTKVSPGCDHCYAEALRKRTGQDEWGNDTRTVTSDAYWRNPIKWNAAAEKEGRRHRVFCASLADVFEMRAELTETRHRLWDVITDTPSLDWQFLTKRPENVMPLVPYDWTCHPECWPDNAWIGTTVEDQERADQRIPELLAIPAKVRFLSCEPLVGPVSLIQWLNGGFGHVAPDLHWVIVGGESGAGHRALDVDHARSLRDECLAAGVPFFFKQVGGRTPTAGGDELDGVKWKQFPASCVNACSVVTPTLPVGARIVDQFGAGVIVAHYHGRFSRELFYVVAPDDAAQLEYWRGQPAVVLTVPVAAPPPSPAGTVNTTTDEPNRPSVLNSTLQHARWRVDRTTMREGT